MKMRASPSPLIAVLLSFLGASLMAGAPARAQEPSQRLLVLDSDAHYVAGNSAGALFNFDLAAGTSAAPVVEAAADSGAPFDYLSGLAVSPTDGRAYASDLHRGLPGRIYAVDGTTGATSVFSDDPRLDQPFSMTFLSDGRLVIADLDADPSGLGPDVNMFPGHGAIWIVDPATCTAPCALSVLSDGTSHPGFPGATVSAFEDPVGVAYDPVRDVLYVADAFADPLNMGHLGAVFTVDLTTGFVELVSSSGGFLSLTALGIRTDGSPLVVDALDADSVVWQVDLSDTDPEMNHFFLTSGAQYGLIEGVAVDATDRVFVVDSGIYDDMTMTYTTEPGIYEVDESNTDPDTNGVLVSDSIELVLPVAGVAVAVPAADRVTPEGPFAAPTVVRVQGSNLTPALDFDFGPTLTVSGVVQVAGVPVGTEVELTLTPPATIPERPAGCTVPRADLALADPWSSMKVLVSALFEPSVVGSFAPGPPCSTRGDANCDGIVDGIDLAILGMHFTNVYCDGAAFVNDADFNDDDLIDGSDLAVLATFFGTR